MMIAPKKWEPFDHVELHRGEFPDGTRRVEPNASDQATRDFMRRVHQFGSDLEIVWNPARRKWSLYRIAFWGASPAGDKMVWEFDLDHPPGEWLIAKMQRDVLTRADRSHDHAVAGRRWLQEIKDLNRSSYEARERRYRDIREYAVREMDIYGLRGRCSDVSSRTRRRAKPATLREGAPWMLNPGIPRLNGAPRRSEPTIQIAYR